MSTRQKNNAEKFKAKLEDLKSTEDYIELDDYFALVDDILTELGDKKWAKEIYQGILDGIDEGGNDFYIGSYAGVINDILKTLKDKTWAAKICKKVEGKIGRRGGVFFDYCLLAEIVMEYLKDKAWATKLLKKAENKVEESIGGSLDNYDIEEEDSYYAILAKKILDILDDEKWGANVIVHAIACDMEKYTAPVDCAFLLAFRKEKFADKVWKRLLEEEDLNDARSFSIANAIMTIDGRLYNNGKKNEYKKNETWHQNNIKLAKSFMQKGIEAMEEYSDCDDFVLADTKKTLKILKDPELNRQYKEAQNQVS
jgi:hypothetical protein